jgi:hypothetical protein
MNRIVKDEISKQTIILLFTIATVIVIYYWQSPDAWRTLKMGTALQTKRFAEGQVVWWENVRDTMATVYNREKP